MDDSNLIITNNSYQMIEYILSTVKKEDCEKYDDLLSSSFFEKFYLLINEAKEFVSKINIFKYMKILKENFVKPTDFDYILADIRNEIEKMSHIQYIFNFNEFLGKKIVFHLTFSNNETIISNYFLKMKIIKMLWWIYIITKYTKNCHSNTLNIHIFFTNLKKKLPEKFMNIDKIHVNTGFTTTCNVNSEIVIFRKEEWFKVFLHETFHNFGLDFSNMKEKITEIMIKNIFKVNVKIKLYEAYCEFWARVFNCLIVSFLITSNKKEFLLLAPCTINIERFFSYYQTVKILKHMNLSYEDLFSNNSKSIQKRKNYFQKTSILSYYFICSILFHNFKNFLQWSKNNNNTDILNINFVKTKENQLSFCSFINSHHNDITFLNNISYFEKIIEKTKKSILLDTLKKSIIELN